jgi:hypothetical protein
LLWTGSRVNHPVNQPKEENMAAQSYSGSCHCGAVAFTVEVDP